MCFVNYSLVVSSLLNKLPPVKVEQVFFALKDEIYVMNSFDFVYRC